MDRDFDGRLSFGEFMGEETPLEKVFKSMDKDGDGTVTKEVRFYHCHPDFIVCIISGVFKDLQTPHSSTGQSMTQRCHQIFIHLTQSFDKVYPQTDMEFCTSTACVKFVSDCGTICGIH